MILKGTFGVLIIATLVLSPLDAVMSLSQNGEKIHHPPCVFNSLCTCSKVVPDLGIVTCKDVPLPRIPRHINISKVYMLHLERNQLRYIEPNFLQGTGLFRIEISWNHLTDITPEAFAGLERTLWELDLHNNYLSSIPSRSIRFLQRLRLLDLSGNQISHISNDNWRGVEDSLITLILRNNDIFSLERDIFGPLQHLETLDLSENAILDLGYDAFRTGPRKIQRLFLRENAIKEFPYQQLTNLKQLRHLDLSHNQISRLQSVAGESGMQAFVLSLDTLHLEYNQIQFLPPKAFDSFRVINVTFLDGNPLEILHSDAFHGPKMREIYLRQCYLSDVSPASFNGQHTALNVLDLGGNNLTSIPAQLFNDFNFHTLLLRDNTIVTLPFSYFKGRQYSVNNFDFSGQENGIISIPDLNRFQNLRTLTLSRLNKQHLEAEDFKDFGMDLEELKINNGNLKVIKNNAFKYVRGVKLLDLSDNSLTTIEHNAFEEIGHTLGYLNLADGLSSSVSQLPHEPFRFLSAIRILDLSNNKLKILPESSFHAMKQLEAILLDDNNIEFIPRGTFQADTHVLLKTISFAFNSLGSVPTHTFTNLMRLTTLNLEDNKITRIEKVSFVAMDQLKRIHLRGNKITQISQEAFQNLPSLELLDLAFNKITDFDFGCLDQVGTLSSLKLNMSYNSLRTLKNNVSTYTSDRALGPLHNTIEELDFSHNNITWVDRGYFQPVESSMTHLHLAHNSIPKITKDLLGNMRYLQWLDLNHNRIRDIDFDTFKDIRNIQVLQVSHNFLVELPSGLFQKMTSLRIVDLSHNKLRHLPDFLFMERGIEEVVLNNNLFTRIPVSSFSLDAAVSIINLDFSQNEIFGLSSDTFSRFQTLQKLDLSGNRLHSLEDSSFGLLSQLAVLNISNNVDLSIDSKGQVFRGVEDTLEELYMRNISMRMLPELHLPALRILDISANRLEYIQQDLPQNVSSLRVLHLDENQLDEVPKFISSMAKLRTLSLRNNPIQSINFQPGSHLKELDIRHLPLQKIEQSNGFNRLPTLQTLRLSPTTPKNIAQLLQENYILEHLHLELNQSKTIKNPEEEFRGYFGPKLKNITISGKGFSSIPDNILEGIQSPRVHLVVSNTSIDKIPRTLFFRANRVRNITLDLRGNILKTLGNPNTGSRLNLPRKSFLDDLKLSNNRWQCDCELGWVEGWQRKKRQYLCPGISENCRETPDDFRIAQCHNKREQNLMEVLKYDIECGWNTSSNLCVWRYIISLNLFLLFSFNRYIATNNIYV